MTDATPAKRLPAISPPEAEGGEPRRRPRVRLMGTGGTIAGSVAAADGRQGYQAAVLSVEDVLASVPGIGAVADVTCEQLWQIDSADMDVPLMLRLARHVTEVLRSPDVDGVVITHGTDTMEESSYLLNLVVNATKPVVFTGSMRPSDALSPDGPANVFNAIAVAASPLAGGHGVLVVLDDDIHTARDVEKRHTSHTDAFVSEHGPLGDVSGGRVRFYRALARRHTSTSVFSTPEVLGLETLPPVEVVHTHATMPPEILEAVAASGARGMVHAGPGAGSVPSTLVGTLTELARAGIVVARSTRVAGGSVSRNAAISDDEHGWVAADDLNPWKARLLLALALTRTSDPVDIQVLIDTH